MTATADERLAQTLAELAGTLVAGYDLMEFLQTLTDRCVELLEDAAGLLLADGRGALRLIAASTQQARVMELFQIQNDEGPCLDCYRSGQQPPAAAGYRAAIREAGVRDRMPMPGQRILPGRRGAGTAAGRG